MNSESGEPSALDKLRSVWRPGGDEFPWVLAASTACNILALAMPLLMLQLYDRVIPNRALDTLVLLSIGVIAAVVVESLLRLLRTYIMVWAAARFEHRAMSEGFSRLLAPGTDPGRASDYAERFKSIVSLRDHCSGQNMIQFLDLPFTAIFLVIVAILGGWLVLVPLLGVAVFAWIGWVFSNQHRNLYKQRSEADRRRSNFIVDTLSGIHTVKALAMEAFMLRRYERLHEGAADLTRRLASALDVASGVGGLFAPLITIAVVAAGAYMVIHGDLTNGELAACTLLAMRALGPLQRVGTLWIAREQVRTLYDEVRPLFKGEGLSDERIPLPETPGPGKIELVGASFRFPNAEENLLDDLTLAIPAGQCIVIKGANSSGRSSLLRMIGGLIEPTDGGVMLDGIPLADMPPELVRERIAYVPENSQVFQGSVLDNITGFEPARTERALKIAYALGLDKFVSRLPRGWDSHIGESAAESLPVGHRQRIAMVRALARSTEVVLLDAANISMDNEGDAAMRAYIEAERGRTTFVIVTNRPAMERLADRILLLENGHLVDQPLPSPASPAPAPAAATAVAVTSAAPAPAAQAAAALQRPAEAATTSIETHWGPDAKPSGPEVTSFERLQQVTARTFNKPSDLAVCVPELLRALGWQGSDRDLAEAFPYFEETLDISGVQNSMARLGFESGETVVSIKDIHRKLLPCLYVPENRPAMVLLERSSEGMRVFDPVIGAELVLPEETEPGRAVFFKRARVALVSQYRWVGQAFGRMRPLIGVVMVSAIFYGLLMLPNPLFVMAVYSAVIPSGSYVNLAYLTGGALAAILVGGIFVAHRARILSFIAGRLDYIFGSSVFKQILALPPSMSESAAIGAQVARLNSFESVREIFNGPLAATVAEMPVLIAFVIALGVINPAALIVVALTIGAYVSLYLLFGNAIDRRVNEMVRNATERHEFLVETIGKLTAIRDFGGERTWLARFREISSNAAMAGYRAGRTAAMLASGGYMINTLGGLAVVLVSVYLAYQGSVSLGVVIASMMLTWRLIGPIQTAFTNLTRIDRVRNSLNQMERLMNLRGERAASGYASTAAMPMMRGRVEIDRVSFRYSLDSDAAVLGATFAVEPGQLVVIAGPNGGGKSTMLKLLTGMYQPQAGSIRIDNTDIRQMDPLALRRAIGYVPQECSLFRGTIPQNLRLVRPGATDEEINRALAMAGALNDIALLPDGMNTRPGDGRNDQMSSSLRQKLSLARAYLTNAPILLFDEPANTLDFEGDKRFMETVKRLKGRATMFLVTHRPSHIKMADTVVILEGGYVRYIGPPAEALRRLGFA